MLRQESKMLEILFDIFRNSLTVSGWVLQLMIILFFSVQFQVGSLQVNLFRKKKKYLLFDWKLAIDEIDLSIPKKETRLKTLLLLLANCSLYQPVCTYFWVNNLFVIKQHNKLKCFSQSSNVIYIKSTVVWWCKWGAEEERGVRCKEWGVLGVRCKE